MSGRPDRRGSGSVSPEADTRSAGGARCTVGLLTWNGGDAAEPCVRSVLAQTERPLPIIWIDNASTDGTVERLRRAFPALPEPIVNARNIGFTGGHNQAAARCATPYYLALNQDVVLAPEYVERVCAWLDEAPDLALASGLILRGAGPPGEQAPTAPGPDDRIASAGIVWPRLRFPFELALGWPVEEVLRTRRWVPGVNGAAMILRLAACRAAAIEPQPDPAGGEPLPGILPPDFFAYHEEFDLALKLARMGWRAGVEGRAYAWHGRFSSGGLRRRSIRARALLNHWLLTLRHDDWPTILKELPYLLKGELQFWLPRYLMYPGAFLEAVGGLARGAAAARRFHRRFTAHAAAADRPDRLAEYRRESLRQLRQWKPRRTVAEKLRRTGGSF